MENSYRVESGEKLDSLYLSTPPSKTRTYGFAIAIIIGIGGLVVGGVGIAGYFGVISNLSQIHAIITMVAGGGGGSVLFIVGVVGTVKNCKTGRPPLPPLPPLPANNDLEILRELQTKFIARTNKGKIRDAQSFGKEQWKTYFGDVGNEPPLPEDINTILNSPCPFSGDEAVKVKDTHMLVLIPETINGEKLTLDKLQELIPNPHNEGHPASYVYYGASAKNEHGKKHVDQSYWVLMTKDLVPGSRSQPYSAQRELVNNHSDYGLPGVLEAAVCILMEHVFSGAMLFEQIPLTNTYCAERINDDAPVCVGGFSSKGLYINLSSPFGMSHIGFAALRKF